MGAGIAWRSYGPSTSIAWPEDLEQSAPEVSTKKTLECRRDSAPGDGLVNDNV